MIAPLRLLAPPLVAGAIWWASSRPATALPTMPFFGADKVAHALVFAALAGAIRVGWRWPFAAAVALAVAYGALDEWHQLSVAGRTASLGDVAADALGAVLGAWLGARARP